MPHHRKKIIDVWSGIILFSLVMVEGVIWQSIVMSPAAMSTKIYFLNVTEGESILMTFPNNVKIMTDAGSDAAVAQEIQKILPSWDSYIDLAIISYPQSADYGGYVNLLDHYRVGAFIYDGRNDIVDSKDWEALTDKITAQHIPLITLGAGDIIHYGNNQITIVSPTHDFAQSADVADAAIVQHITIPDAKVLLASDIGARVEAALLEQKTDIRSDILKVPLPAFEANSGDNFFYSIDPKVVVITPGVKNTPSQYSKNMLAKLGSSTKALVINANESGTLEIFPNNGKFLLYNE